MAHEVIDYEWGLFYPSVFGFSLWQAFNKAKSINFKNDYNRELKKVYLTGCLFGMVAGMNMGIYWYHGFLSNYCKCFDSPVISGLFYGFTGAILGFLIEAFTKKSSKKTLISHFHSNLLITNYLLLNPFF
ncbi:hypothetical protein ACFRCQ_26080 [Cytobacillus firmus]|uniref:hypothetical protein n=1 Tax=Cytobacillus firmus TaxID=1399 RepID=UPI0036CAA483